MQLNLTSVRLHVTLFFSLLLAVFVFAFPQKASAEMCGTYNCQYGVSWGFNGTYRTCHCKSKPADAPPPTANPSQSSSSQSSSSNGVPSGPSSGCCDNTGQCRSWYGSASTCTNSNGACRSGVQCKGGSGGGGTCTQSCGASDCHKWICNNQIECNGGCYGGCGNGICETNGGENPTTCPQDCKSGTNLGQTCTPGKIYCQRDFSNFSAVTGCPSSTNQLYGTSCGQDGKFHTNVGCGGYDACASGTLEGASCAGKTRLSCGESTKGGFVGCLGAKNCFCGAGSPSSQVGTPPNVRLTCNPGPGHVYTANDGVVHCFDDVGNDSCGAHGATPSPTAGPNTCYRCHSGAAFCESYTSSTACTTNCDACKPPPSGTAPPSAPPFVCLSINKDVNTPTFGQSVRFTCGTVNTATRYEFRYKVETCKPRPACLDAKPACKIAQTPDMCPPLPNPSCRPRPACLDAKPPCELAMPAEGWCPTNGVVGDIQPLNPGSNLTQPFAITHVGSYKVQCRPCIEKQCAPWAENW